MTQAPKLTSPWRAAPAPRPLPLRLEGSPVLHEMLNNPVFWAVGWVTGVAGLFAAVIYELRR